MAQITTTEQVRLAREFALQAAKAYAKRPADVKALRTRADELLKDFDRAAMKDVVEQAKGGIHFLQDEVAEVATAAINAEFTAYICDDYESSKALFDTPRHQAHLFRDLAKTDIAALADIQGDITRSIKKAEEAYGAGKAAEAAIDELEAALKKAGDNLRAQHDKLDPLHERALAVAKSRDAAALTNARTAFNGGFEALEKTWRDGEAMHRDFTAKHLKAAPLTAGKRHAMQARLDAALKSWQPNEVLRDGAVRWAKEVRELAVASVDGKKAAAVLGLEAKDAAAVAEAMQGDESVVRKKLEALGKKLKHQLNGKDMFERLRKAKMA